MATPIHYTLYLDACGDPGWCPPHGKSNITNYVIAGLALTGSANLTANTEVEELLRKYIPKGWLAPRGKREICYHHLIRGKGIYESLTHEQRLAMADEIFALISKLQPVLFATVVNKQRMKQRYGNRAYDPKIYAIQATIHRFAMFLKRQTNGVGAVIMDSEEYRKDHLLQEMVRNFKSTGIIIRGMDYQPRYEERLERILDTIAFSDSDLSSGIQLADVCCRTVWQHYENAKSNRFNQLTAFWNKDASRVFEPSVIPK